MGEQQKFLTRIGSWFRRNQETAADQPYEDDDSHALSGGEPGGGGDEPRHTFLRPWARRDQAMDNLQRGIGALSDLLVSLRDNMEKQAQRQEELLGHLSHLPDALQAIPESSRVQNETFKAIQQQIERQTTQQGQLGQVLDKISQADNRQGRTLEALQQTVTAMNDHDAAISQNLQTLGSALASVTQNSHASATVLEQLRDNTSRRDGELERVIKRQNTRFTTLLTIAIVLSIAALTAVSVFGYLAYDALTKVK